MLLRPLNSSLRHIMQVNSRKCEICVKKSVLFAFSLFPFRIDGWMDCEISRRSKTTHKQLLLLLSVKDLQQVFRRNSAKISTQNKSKLNMETSSDFQIVFSKSDFFHVILPAKIRRINVQLAVSEYSLIFFFIRLFVILTGLHQINIKRCLITFSKCPSKVCTFSRS